MKSVFRLCLAFVVFTAYSIPAAAHLYGIWLVTWIFRAPAARRRWAGAWRGWWGDQALKAVCFCLDIRVDFDLPEETAATRGMPMLVIANHRKTLDILILATLMRRCGRPQARWVLKRQLRHRALYIGHSCIMTECAFVGREGDVRDLAEIDRCARRAREDGASVILFPEGTRFAARRRRDGFSQVLPPKRGGFAVLREALPDYPILSVTLHWEGKDGRTMFDSHSAVGTRLRVTCRVIPPEAVVGDAWLEGEWREKDRELSAARQV